VLKQHDVQAMDHVVCLRETHDLVISTDDDPGTLVKEHVVRLDVYFRDRI
jgi:hypothetical protein